MRRRNGGAGVAPAPLCNAHRRSGSPWVPVRPYYEGPPSQGGRGGPDEGRRKPPGSRRMKVPRFGPDETVPGWKTPQWSAGRRRARKARGTFTEVPDQDVAPNGAPLPQMCEGKGNDGGPHADQIMGTMNHVCLMLENFAGISDPSGAPLRTGL